ncbi:nucleobase:cation symporter-2 family protein [Sedimentibacter sp.]|uniref:uracil-xanthine permease family protein n=1 Tax=Sedimentibacter sp. TaxID=1960295 RepID=UPI0028B04DC5|nr:nucleobase:cation symporter-2 family protein [Sedimentibacter sp.]
MKENKSKINIIYGIEDKPVLSKAVPLAFQHVLAMFAGNITVPLLLSALLVLSKQETAFLIQCALFTAGITTFIQIIRYKGIGSGLPIVMGTSNAFIPVVLAIAKTSGIGGVLGAGFIGGLFEIFIGKNLSRLKRFLTPMLSGVVVLTIGITLIPVAIRQAAGGNTDMGNLRSILVSSIVLVTIIIFNQNKNKFLKSSSILLGLMVGYIISFFMGEVDISPVIESNWVSMPRPFAYKWIFEPGAVIAMLFMYIATSIETIGDISALTIGAEGREPRNEEMSGGVIADGLGSSLAALFNGFPNTSYTQNIGVVSLTGVFSRHVVKIGGIILIILSLFPKFASLIAIMPEPVLGGAAIAMFSMIAVTGISLLQNIELNSRNILIITVSLGLSIGLNLVPEATQQLPANLQLILRSGVVPSALITMVLDVVLPENQ